MSAKSHGAVTTAFLLDRLERLMENRSITGSDLSRRVGERHLVSRWRTASTKPKPRIPRWELLRAVAEALQVPCEAFAPLKEAQWTKVSRFEDDRFDRLLPDIRGATTAFTLHRMFPSSLAPRQCFESPLFRQSLLAQGWRPDLVDPYINNLKTRVGGSVIPAHCRQFIMSDRTFIKSLSKEWLETVVPFVLQAHQKRAIAVGFLEGADYDAITEQIRRITNMASVERLTIFDDMFAIIRTSWDHYAYTYHPSTVDRLRRVLDGAADHTNIPMPICATEVSKLQQYNQRVLQDLGFRPSVFSDTRPDPRKPR